MTQNSNTSAHNRLGGQWTHVPPPAVAEAEKSAFADVEQEEIKTDHNNCQIAPDQNASQMFKLGSAQIEPRKVYNSANSPSKMAVKAENEEMREKSESQNEEACYASLFKRPESNLFMRDSS